MGGADDGESAAPVSRQRASDETMVLRYPALEYQADHEPSRPSGLTPPREPRPRTPTTRHTGTPQHARLDKPTSISARLFRGRERCEHTDGPRYTDGFTAFAVGVLQQLGLGDRLGFRSPSRAELTSHGALLTSSALESREVGVR